VRQVGPVLYVNCGDWVESRTAIVEHLNGGLELVRWDEETLLEDAGIAAADAMQPAA
jgi:hypothetical protein